MVLYYSLISDADLCKGSTNDSDSFCPGSNPGSAAKRLSIIDSLFCCLFFLVYHKKKMTDAFLSVIIISGQSELTD